MGNGSDRVIYYDFTQEIMLSNWNFLEYSDEKKRFHAECTVALEEEGEYIPLSPPFLGLFYLGNVASLDELD